MAKLIFRDFAIICGKIMEEYQSKSNETLKVCLVSSSSAFFYDTLKITNDELEDNEGCDIINWGGVYEIRAKKQASTPPPIAIVQKTATKNGKDYILTCYKDSTIKFLLESASDHLPIAPFVEILTPEIIMQDSGNSVLFVAKAACQDGTYLLMLSAFPEMKILFEDSGSSVNYNNNEISITKTIDDMLMREKTSIYHYENGCSILKSNMFKYTNEHIYIDELKPYLLLEAVMAEDIEYAKSLLSDELAENAAMLADFFGEIREITYPKYGKENAALALVGKSGKVTYYNFEFNNGKISNILTI